MRDIILLLAIWAVIGGITIAFSPIGTFLLIFGISIAIGLVIYVIGLGLKKWEPTGETFIQAALMGPLMILSLLLGD